MIIERDIVNELMRNVSEFPVVAILGPRQSGKTTLVRMTFSEYTYVNLEHPEARLLAREDPKSFFAQFPPPIVLDEIQNVPELLSYIQVWVDEHAHTGQYILTGSHQPRLQASLGQSLAGRVGILFLLPLSIHEVEKAGFRFSWDKLIYKGFMPAVYAKKRNPVRLYRNYFRTYVERDVRSLIRLKRLIPFENFMRLLAGRCGQIMNLHSLSGDVGVSSVTLKEWLSVLEASFIIFRLPPFFENVGTRVVKSSKIYFTDVGLLAYLLGINSSKHVLRDPLRGNLFENMVVLEALKTGYNFYPDIEFYFYRDARGNEVDLIVKSGRRLIPVEIKSAMTFNQEFIKGVKRFEKIFPKADGGVVFYTGDLDLKVDRVKVQNFKKIMDLIASTANTGEIDG